MSVKRPSLFVSHQQCWWWVPLLLAAVVAVLFHDSFVPRYTVFSNDGPLGAITAQGRRPPDVFTGAWMDLNSIGSREGAAPNITYTLQWLLGPLIFSKFYAPLSVLFVSLSAWLFFRQAGLSLLSQLLGSLAVALNSDFLSTSCWGVAGQTFCFGLCFLSLAGLVSVSRSRLRAWIKTCLAGFAVGFAVMEGADIGALFSILIAAFVLWHSVAASESFIWANAARGLFRVGAVAVCAGFIATQVVLLLVGTQIKGVAGAEQTDEAKAARWGYATQWSLPKKETLALVVPGLFGYRMDTPQNMEMFKDNFENGNYWGMVGSDLSWDQYLQNDGQGQPPQVIARFTGGGNFLGVLVALVAFWTALQALRKNSVFSLTQRRLIWFWSVVAFVSVLFAWGRFAPFYKIIYALPYFSTIRNPAKFLHIFSFASLILFAYGLDGLSKRYFDVPFANSSGLGDRLKKWWSKAAVFDKGWVMGCFLAVVASLAGWLIYAGSSESLARYMTKVDAMGDVSSMAAFSIHQAGWFVLLFAIAVALITLTLTGAFAGRRAKVGWILIGLFVVVDLGRADLPWLVYWNYKQKYASNPVIDQLREKPYEHRVAILPFDFPRQFSSFCGRGGLYTIEWLNTSSCITTFNLLMLCKCRAPLRI